MATARVTSTQPAQFSGFPTAAIDFFDELEENNNRDWWHANKHRYDAVVRGPLDAFLAGVAKEFGQAHVFRPNRDTRFAHDKSPYKTNIGAVTYQGATVYYVHLDGGGLMAASGYYMMAPDQIQRFRIAAADPKTGAALRKIVDDASSQGLALGGPALKRVPSPFPKDHVNADLLRLKSVTLARQFGTPKWMSSPRAADEIVAVWRACSALNKWLAKHVGTTRNDAPNSPVRT
jgi:uncharacterized protein (TIGR02453 family)